MFWRSKPSWPSGASPFDGGAADHRMCPAGLPLPPLYSAKLARKLDWRMSIVDLMKLLNLDSSLAARKQLARDLRYAGDTSDSASMNIWLPSR